MNIKPFDLIAEMSDFVFNEVKKKEPTEKEVVNDLECNVKDYD